MKVYKIVRSRLCYVWHHTLITGNTWKASSGDIQVMVWHRNTSANIATFTTTTTPHHTAQVAPQTPALFLNSFPSLMGQATKPIFFILTCSLHWWSRRAAVSWSQQHSGSWCLWLTTHSLCRFEVYAASRLGIAHVTHCPLLPRPSAAPPCFRCFLWLVAEKCPRGEVRSDCSVTLDTFAVCACHLCTDLKWVKRNVS